MIQTIQGADGASVSDYTRSVISRVEVWDFHQFFHRFSFGWVGVGQGYSCLDLSVEMGEI